MAALVSREVLDALVDPKFQAELPQDARKQIKLAVARAGKGAYGELTLSYAAGPVREAARRLKAKPRVSRKLRATLPQLERIPGY